MKDVLVSVIVTTYKGTDTLGRAVESVMHQTYRNLEIIVVDDNGLGTEFQQETEKMTAAFQDDRIRYIPHEVNKNGSAARNTGIAAAHGKYIALLDDDDAFRADKIEKQVALLESKPDYALCYTGMTIHHPDGKAKECVYDRSGELFEEVICRTMLIPSSVMMFTKASADAIGGFDASFRHHQDWEFLDRMAYAYKICALNEPATERYLMFRNSANNPKKFEEFRLHYLNVMMPYIDKLPPQKRTEILDRHNRSIAKEYAKAKDFGTAIRYFRKCSRPMAAMVDSVMDYIHVRQR